MENFIIATCVIILTTTAIVLPELVESYFNNIKKQNEFKINNIYIHNTAKKTDI